MSAVVRLGLLAFSASVAALVVTLVMPFTDPESLASLTSHPIGARVVNITNAAIYGFARLLEGVSSAETHRPSLHCYHPLAATNACAYPAAEHARDLDLDWSNPEVWRLQQERLRGPFYTTGDVERLLHWCADVGSAGNGVGRSAGGVDISAEAVGKEATAEARFGRLVQWVAANGGDACKVRLGVSHDGVRGLHAARPIAAGEVAVAVPLRTGLSAATFRAARALAGPTTAWRAVEDADLFLDALALSYEVAVHGERSPWADYLCLLPRSYGGLPVHISDPSVASLLAEMPGLRRLAAKRRAQLDLFGSELARTALGALPGGRSALARLAAGAGRPAPGAAAKGVSGGRDLWLPLWHWAYAAAKTRSVTLAAEEVRHVGGSTPPGEAPPLRLPLALEWVQEFGMLLPILDLANHAFDGRGANVAYQLLPDASGGGLAACLVALEPLTPGQPLLFDYVAESEAAPACVDRWLLEYGFVPDSASDTARDCDTFDVTAADVAWAVLLAEAGDEPMGDQHDQQPIAVLEAVTTTHAAIDSRDLDSVEAEIRDRLLSRAKDGLPARLEVHIRQPYNSSTDTGQGYHVVQRWAVLQWLKAALRGRVQGQGQQGAGRDWASMPGAQKVLKVLLQERWKQLGRVEERALGLDSTGQGCLEGQDGVQELWLGLAAVAAAGRRALWKAISQEVVLIEECPNDVTSAL